MQSEGRTQEEAASCDAYAPAKEAIRQAVLSPRARSRTARTATALSKAGLVTQENVNTIQNLWSRPDK